MTIAPETTTPSDASRLDLVECELCGTRMRRNLEPHPLEIGSDAFISVARHRCAPRVTARRQTDA
jgi:hypothetical protein